MPAVKESPTAMSKARTGNGNPSEGTSAQTPDVARGGPPSPAAGSPFAFMRRFAEEMDRLFDDFGMGHGLRTPSLVSRGRELLRRETGLVPADWSPQVDVVERDGRFTVRADLPGLANDDVKVEIRGDVLTIEGERRQEAEQEREGHYYNECSYGRFYRAIPLPQGAKAAEAAASFRDGVLEVSMPSPPREETRTRRVEVSGGK